MRPDGPRDLFAGPDSGPVPPFPLKLDGKVIKGFGRGSSEVSGCGCVLIRPYTCTGATRRSHWDHRRVFLISSCIGMVMVVLPCSWERLIQDVQFWHHAHAASVSQQHQHQHPRPAAWIGYWSPAHVLVAATRHGCLRCCVHLSFRLSALHMILIHTGFANTKLTLHYCFV